MIGLVYITTDGCHLCEHGRTVLDDLRVEQREIGAESDEAVGRVEDLLLAGAHRFAKTP